MIDAEGILKCSTKSLLTINNHQSTIYDSQLRLTIESLQSRISARVCFAMTLNLSVNGIANVLSWDRNRWNVYCRVPLQLFLFSDTSLGYRSIADATSAKTRCYTRMESP